MANHVVGNSKRMVTSTGRGAQKDMGAAAATARQYSHLSPSMGGSDTSRNGERAKLGTQCETMCRSSHNDINRFTRGISEHHAYNQRSGAFDANKRAFQANPETRSQIKTPSGGTKSVANRKVSEVRMPDRYNDPHVQNVQPAGVTSRNPNGPRGGLRAIMNRLGGRK